MPSEDAKEIPTIPLPPPPVSPLDPDFLLFAMPFALLIDILDWFLELGTLVSLLLGAPLIIWMVIRAGKGINVADLQQKQAAKTAGKRALRRGILVFVAELIPILNLVPFWIIAVVSTLRSYAPMPIPPKDGTITQ